MTTQRGQVWKVAEHNWAYRYRSPDGKRPQRAGFLTKGEATTALTAHLDRLRIGGQYRPNTTFREIHAEFFALYVAEEVTVKWMKFHAAKALKEFGDQHPDDLDGPTVARWKAGLSNTGSANQTLRIFRQILRAAIGWGWIRTNAAAKVKNRVPEPDEVSFFPDWTIVDAVAAELDDEDENGERIHSADGSAILIVGVGTGAMPEELFGLNWSDIDLEGRTITFRRVYTKGKLSTQMKTKKRRRTVPMRDRVYQALVSLPHRRGAVFHGSRGARIDLHNWRSDFWKPAFEAAGVDYLVPYAWRHTFATWSLASGISIFEVAKLMGTSVAQIDRTYGHLMPDAGENHRSIFDAFDAVGVLRLGREQDVSQFRTGEA